MKSVTTTVSLSEGLDAKGIAMCVQNACLFNSEIHFSDGVRRMNAKSIMGMMTLGLALGDDVTIETEGSDEEEALKAMRSFVEGK